MREPATGVVSAVFQVTGLGWVLEVPLSSLEGDVSSGDFVTCPAVEARHIFTVKSWNIPRKLGEPCVVFVVGKVPEALVQSWLHQQVFFAATNHKRATGKSSVRFIVQLVNEAQGSPEIQATSVLTSRHI